MGKTVLTYTLATSNSGGGQEVGTRQGWGFEKPDRGVQPIFYYKGKVNN